MPAGVYMHIPFCATHCHYCSFYSEVVRPASYDAYVRELAGEIRQAGERDGRPPIDSIYFGGGTPSLLGAERIECLLAECRAAFTLLPASEITLEMNPTAQEAADLQAFREAGINRLSIGVQAFQDHLLQRLGRTHSAAEAKKVLRLAGRSGFRSLSLDLMYGLPGQTVRDFEKSLLTAVHLPVQHISVYGLSVDEGTHFGALAARGQLHMPTETEEWQMYRAMNRITANYGFQRYELSNFCRPGHAAVHNTKYWRGAPYYGFGAGAVGCRNGLRTTHAADWRRYVQHAEAGDYRPVECEVLSPEVCMEEYCFLHLRLREGICTADFKRRFGKEFESMYGSVCRSLLERRLLRRTAQGVALTAKGAALANPVMAEFMLTHAN
ncbi:MAG: radical SAM family heme chaperone HemW [Veillonellaceae bacterium]|nr:radical SAM family heme chaperone HemW [Veillonellaceae bacterium]